jgi:hypothetical protein
MELYSITYKFVAFAISGPKSNQYDRHEKCHDLRHLLQLFKRLKRVNSLVVSVLGIAREPTSKLGHFNMCPHPKLFMLENLE